MTTYQERDAYWLGRFSMQTAMALRWIRLHPKIAEKELRGLLNEYLRSPLPTPEEAQQLREKMRQR